MTLIRSSYSLPFYVGCVPQKNFVEEKNIRFPFIFLAPGCCLSTTTAASAAAARESGYLPEDHIVSCIVFAFCRL